ncbi:GTP pyrophosphokinase family protein [Streptomyces massasporeus]|uniref:GTP pyrophosphokinase n=1 Tax=Streptomyces massasporeus TaxID=67324 RepID=UPI0036E46E1E
MSNTETPTEFYESRKGSFEDVCTEVTYALEKELRTQGIKYHSVTSRVKTIESFLEKIERKDYSDPIKQTTDLAGVRVVCLFMKDLDRVNEVIQSLFEVFSEEDKLQQGDADSFGYMSRHYICGLSSVHTGPRYDHIQGMKFEVQVRTILMDAWANISHYLNYKTEQSVPRDLVRDFAALSGLLYVADRQFEELSKASSRSAADAEQKILHSQEIAPSEVNADTVHALLLREFPDRQESSAEKISSLTSQLRASGFSDIGEVATLLQSVAPAAAKVEEEVFSAGNFDIAAYGRFCMALGNSEFRQTFLKTSAARGTAEDAAKAASRLEQMVQSARDHGYRGE